MSAKTEAEAFLKLQEAANLAHEFVQSADSIHDEGVSEAIRIGSVFRIFAEHTALPKLTLEVVARLERAEQVLHRIANGLSVPGAHPEFLEQEEAVDLIKEWVSDAIVAIFDKETPNA